MAVLIDLLPTGVARGRERRPENERPGKTGDIWGSY